MIVSFFHTFVAESNTTIELTWWEELVATVVALDPSLFFNPYLAIIPPR
jgi:hypothetical protein